MVSLDSNSGGKKRRRQRIDFEAPREATLRISDDLADGQVIISQSTFQSLQLREQSDQDLGFNISGNHTYLALAPWKPTHLIPTPEDAWTIICAQVVGDTPSNEIDDDKIEGIIWVSPKAPFSQIIHKSLTSNPFDLSSSAATQGYHVCVLPVEPIPLQTIYISVDGKALDHHEQVQRKFGGGFIHSQADGYSKKGQKTVAKIAKKEPRAESLDDQLTTVIRSALEAAVVVRRRDTVALALPSHPITHAKVPPGLILMCEPVDQGIVTSKTRIIVNRVGSLLVNGAPTLQQLPMSVLSSSKSVTDFDSTDGHVTSNEAYLSAVENGHGTTPAIEADSAATSEDQRSTSSETDSDDSSDDELISMQTPAIALHQSSTISSRATATPRGFHRSVNGLHTPGSIFSNMTSATTRSGEASKGRLFCPMQLFEPFPEELLQPTPIRNEDEQCRVYVDMKALVRLGCFSGDWVSLASEQASDQLKKLMPGRTAASPQLARIYGLQNAQPFAVRRSGGGMPQPRLKTMHLADRNSSMTLKVWLPPLLLANLGMPDTIRVCPLYEGAIDSSNQTRFRPRKIDSTTSPLVAQEIILVKILTPLSTDRTVQAGIFLALKQYFERRRRVLKQGQVIAVPLDAKLCRLIGDVDRQDADKSLTAYLEVQQAGQTSYNSARGKRLNEVAWFRVGQVKCPDPTEAADLAPDAWHGFFTIDPSITRMRQMGSEEAKLPPVMRSSWPFYYNASRMPQRPWHSLSYKLQQTRHLEYISPIRQRFRELSTAATSPRALHLAVNPVLVLFHSTQRRIGKSHLVQRTTADLGLHLFVIDASDIVAEGVGGSTVKAEALLKARVERAMTCGKQVTMLLIKHIDALEGSTLVSALIDLLPTIRIVAATTTELDKVADELRSAFTHEIELCAPNEKERAGILRDIVHDRGIRLSSSIDISSIALKTAAMVAGNLCDIISGAEQARLDRLEVILSDASRLDQHDRQRLPTLSSLLLAKGEQIHTITLPDMDRAIEQARLNFAASINAPKIPNVAWEDVGGLDQVKHAISETIQLPLSRPDLFKTGMKKRSGILFYGPPGTGKTLLAKAIATEFSLNFFSIKGPELLNMYIGESEANVRRVFQRARDARPCVVFFDELDSVAPKRGNQGDSGGVMDRIVSQLLAELDGMSSDAGEGVFVIGATNRPDLLDPALLRPGRFDKMLYLGVADTHTKQARVLAALTRKFVLAGGLGMEDVAQKLPFTYTGADLYALCSDAMLKAVTRQAHAVDEKVRLAGVSVGWFWDHLATEEDTAVVVTETDFVAAQRELVPSVSVAELEHYGRVRLEFEGAADAKKQVPTSLAESANGDAGAPYTALATLDLNGEADCKTGTEKWKSRLKSRFSGALDKGKGKARAVDSTPMPGRPLDDDDDDDDAYVTSNDFVGP